MKVELSRIGEPEIRAALVQIRDALESTYFGMDVSITITRKGQGCWTKVVASTKQLLNCIEANGPIRTSEIAVKLGISEANVCRRVSILYADGQVQREKHPTGQYYLYSSKNPKERGQ